jgi:hypothetical protein
MAPLSGHGLSQMRAAVRGFLDSDVFQVPVDGCLGFLDPIIESWKIDIQTFRMEIVLNRHLASGGVRRFAFMESPLETPEPGFEQFLDDKNLSGDATADELEFLRALQFKGRQPSPLYYYRELQSLRDPLHFPTAN